MEVSSYDTGFSVGAASEGLRLQADRSLGRVKASIGLHVINQHVLTIVQLYMKWLSRSQTAHAMVVNGVLSGVLCVSPQHARCHHLQQQRPLQRLQRRRSPFCG